MTVKEKIERAAEEKERQNRGFRSWWRKNGYKVCRVVLFPIWICVLCKEKYAKYRSEHFTEDVSKTKRYIDKAIPKLVKHYVEDPSCILISFGSFGYYGDFSTEDFKNKFVVGHRIAQYFYDIGYYRRRDMLLDYDIDGYEKMVIDNWIKWDKAVEMFGWEPNYDKDKDKAVVFYLKEKYGEARLE